VTGIALRQVRAVIAVCEEGSFTRAAAREKATQSGISQHVAAVERILEACKRHGIAAGIHTAAGEIAAQRLRQGYTFTTVASDLTHLELAAKAHLAAARSNAGTAEG